MLIYVCIVPLCCAGINSVSFELFLSKTAVPLSPIDSNLAGSDQSCPCTLLKNEHTYNSCIIWNDVCMGDDNNMIRNMLITIYPVFQSILYPSQDYRSFKILFLSKIRTVFVMMYQLQTWNHLENIVHNPRNILRSLIIILSSLLTNDWQWINCLCLL